MKQKVLTVKNFVFALVTMLVAAAVAFAFSFNANERFVKAEDGSMPMAVYVIGASGVTDTENGFDVTEATDTAPKTYTYADHAAGWNAAIADSVNNAGPVTVKLAGDWTAAEVTSGDPAVKTGSSFGTGDGFAAGHILVPASANITLDLSGFTIDRNLSDVSAVENGNVITTILGATLTVKDSGTNGSITGGNTTTNGGGIENYGTLCLEGGIISGNTAGEVGGGIYTNGDFVMNGGKISDNTVEGTTVSGGGLAVIGGATELNGGEITGNTAIKSAEQGSAAVGGGVWVRSGANVSVSGNPVIKENTVDSSRNNFVFNSVNTKLAAGKLTEGAEIYITIDSGTAFVTGYFDNNTDAPDTYFKSDKDGISLAGNRSGEVVAVAGTLAFSATYGTQSATYNDTFTYENGVTATYGITYNGAAVEGLTLRKNGETATEINGVGQYKISAALNALTEIEYSITIAAKELSASNADITLGSENYYYDGEAVEPTFTLKDGEATLESGTDYDFTYSDNNAVGTAHINVTFKGNYAGTVTYDFEIKAPTHSYTRIDLAYSSDKVHWSTDNPNWVYDGTDRTDYIRFELETNDGNKHYVYAGEGSGGTAGLHLEISGEFEGNPVYKIVNACEYTVTVVGTTEYSFGALQRTKTVTVERAEFVTELVDSDLTDSDPANRLWVLKLGEGTAYLRDTATYYDRDAAINEEYGAPVTTGSLNNSYVRYTGEEREIILNLDFRFPDSAKIIGGLTIRECIERGYFAEPYYDGNSNIDTGTLNDVTEVTTYAAIILGGNYRIPADSAAAGDDRINIPAKTWYIVNINNALRTIDDSGEVSVSNWTYGDEIAQKPFRPEHGDSAIYTLRRGETLVARFAVGFTGDSVATSAASYYGVKTQGNNYLLDENKSLGDDYFDNLLSELGIGSYTLNVFVAQYKATSGHTHWYESDGTSDAEDAVFYPINRTFNFNVGIFTLSADTIDNEIEVVFGDDRVAYNAMNNNIPEITILFNGKELTEGVDYTLTSDRIVAGSANLVILGEGNFEGTIMLENAYTIVQATNTWREVPSIMYWSKGDYNKDVNFINAVPTYLDAKEDLWFKITTDEEGAQPVEGLAKFGLAEGGKVSDEVASALAGLEVGTYYLFATVESNTNYLGLAPHGVAFRVFAGVNAWATTPTITTWTEGKFTDENLPVAVAKFGDAVIVITDKAGTEIYNSETGLNNLASAKYGEYVLTAKVNPEAEYSGLDVYTVNFQIFKKPGIPAWGVLLIVLGALLVVAAVIFTLWKVGVFQILTDKLTIAIRTKATVDATIAAVRASKKSAQAKTSVEAAKALEAKEARMKALLAAAEARRNMSPEEAAAELEAKAAQAAKKAERLQKRSAKMNRRLEKEKKLAEAQAAENNETAENTESAENENGNTQE